MLNTRERRHISKDVDVNEHFLRYSEIEGYKKLILKFS
jgi:hypothetical protein